MDYVARGFSNKQIARELQIQLATVKNHVHNVLEKLDTHHRGEAVAKLLCSGMLTLQEGEAFRKSIPQRTHSRLCSHPIRHLGMLIALQIATQVGLEAEISFGFRLWVSLWI